MISKLAVQMFTLRDFTKTRKDLETTLKRCADMGYKAVQMSAIGCMGGDNPEVSAADAKAILDENGLKCIATHRAWGPLMNDLDSEIEFHKTLDCDYAAIGGIDPEEYESTYEGYRLWLAHAKPVIEGLKAEGIRFGHHNHSREFFCPEMGGPSLEDIIIDEGGVDLMLELDLFWVQHAGANPVSIMERCKGRVPVIHLKDKKTADPTKNETSIAAIGEGAMDWASIIPACEAAGVDWYCVEQDVCDRDAFDCVLSSYTYINENFGG